MATKVKKSIFSEIKRTTLSRSQKNKLSKAITDIDTVPVETLLKTGKVKSIGTPNCKFYMYRVGNKDRIIFSVNDKDNIIHDIIDASEVNALKQGTNIP